MNLWGFFCVEPFVCAVPSAWSAFPLFILVTNGIKAQPSSASLLWEAFADQLPALPGRTITARCKLGRPEPPWESSSSRAAALTTSHHRATHTEQVSEEPPGCLSLPSPGTSHASEWLEVTVHAVSWPSQCQAGDMLALLSPAHTAAS